jgi:hypothetical protein
MFVSQENNISELPIWRTDMSSRLARFLQIRGRPSAPVTNLEKGPIAEIERRIPFPSAAEPRNLPPGVSFRFYFGLFYFLIWSVWSARVSMEKDDFARWGRGTDGPNLAIYKTFGTGR